MAVFVEDWFEFCGPVSVADITGGLEARVLFVLKDLKRAYVDQSFHEEYARRVISEQPTGNKKIIGDKEGHHVDYHDFTWGEFLIKQMIYRINFKYQRSSFPPSEDTRKELLTIAAETIQAYDFDKFRSLKLIDLETNTTETISKTQLQAIKITPPRPPGKLHKIKFEIGPPSNE